MKKNEINLFRKYLHKSEKYFEFGSGGSTIFAINNNIKNIISVETDIDWINKLKLNNNANNMIKNDKLQIYHIDIACKWWEYVSWATPCMNQPNKNNWPSYSMTIKNCPFIPDLILIDGRFRVASALEAYKIMTDKTFLLFHDYTNRSQYHVIEPFFDKIECCKTLQVFRKKNKCDNLLLQNTIDKYRLIMD